VNNKIANKIKHRDIPNDVFYTPEGLVKKCISLVPLSVGDLVLDSAFGKGVFYQNYPKFVKKDFCEISMGKNFFEYNKVVDWIVTNPPYSCLDAWLEKSCGICRKGFGYLFGLHNLTPRRIELCEKNEFFLEKIHLTKGKLVE